MKDFYGIEINECTSFYETKENIILSFFSIKRYIEENLNEGYNNLNTTECIEVLIDQNIIKEKNY